MTDWTVILSGLGGSLAGGAAAIIAQLVTQSSIAKRDSAERARRETRIKALFASYVEAAASTTRYAAAGLVWEPSVVLKSLEPFIALMNEPEMCLALEPAQIRSASEARSTMEICIRTATDRKRAHDRPEPDAYISSEARAAADDNLRRILTATYSNGFAALNACLLTLGAKLIEPYQVDEL